MSALPPAATSVAPELELAQLLFALANAPPALKQSSTDALMKVISDKSARSLLLNAVFSRRYPYILSDVVGRFRCRHGSLLFVLL